MKKIIFLVVFAVFTLFLFYSFALSPAFSKKKITRQGGSKTISSGSKLIIKPKLRSDRRALIVNFSNLGAISSFSYSLEYNSNGIPQGVSGTVTPQGEESIQREILFGTCSHNVCRYHTGISEMRFIVTSTLKSKGIKVRKIFKIKV